MSEIMITRWLDIIDDSITQAATELNKIASMRRSGLEVTRAQQNLSLRIPKGFVASETKKVLRAYVPYAYQNGPYRGYGNEDRSFLSNPYFRHIVNMLNPESSFSRVDRMARRDQVWVILDSLRQTAQIQEQGQSIPEHGESGQTNPPLGGTLEDIPFVKYWNPTIVSNEIARSASSPGDRESVPERISDNSMPAESGAMPSWLKWAGAAGLAWWILA